jgi:hypothetical protein
MQSTVQTTCAMITGAAYWVSLIAAYQSIRLYHWVLIKFRFLFHPSRVYTTVRYILLYGDHTEVQAIVPRSLPDTVIVVEDIQQHTMTGAIKRACIIRPNAPDTPFAPCQPPWWFIGAKLRSGEEICMTDLMAPYIVAGNVVTPQFLTALSPDVSQNGGLLRWFYIHPTSFEDTEIPPEGITIRQDVSGRPDPIRTPPHVVPEEDEDDDDHTEELDDDLLHQD